MSREKLIITILVLFFVFFGSFILWFLGPANKKSDNHINEYSELVEAISESHIIKYSHQMQSFNEWKAEAWLGAGSAFVGESMPIYIRFSRLDSNIVDLSIKNMSINVKKKGSQIQINYKYDSMILVNYSNKKPQMELVYRTGDKEGKLIKFHPSGSCWEGRILEKLKASKKPEETDYLEAGLYTIDIDFEIPDLKSFHFEKLDFEIR